MVRRGLRVRREKQDYRELPAQGECLDPRVQKVILAHQVSQETLENKDIKVLKVNLVDLETTGNKVIQVCLEILVQEGMLVFKVHLEKR